MIEAQLNWSLRHNFPYAIGAIDCTHIEISKPVRHPDEYINRKVFHSINVQATCDAFDKFTSVDISWPGSVHDSRILKNSELYRLMQTNVNVSNAVILGDQGYGITPWLMTKHKNAATDLDKIFDNILIKDRISIEKCFGQLKRRFPVLGYKLRVKENSIPIVIGACFVLHNVAKFLNEEDFDKSNVDEEIPVEPEVVSSEDEWTDARMRRAGQLRRAAIVNEIGSSYTR